MCKCIFSEKQEERDDFVFCLSHFDRKQFLVFACAVCHQQPQWCLSSADVSVQPSFRTQKAAIGVRQTKKPDMFCTECRRTKWVSEFDMKSTGLFKTKSCNGSFSDFFYPLPALDKMYFEEDIFHKKFNKPSQIWIESDTLGRFDQVKKNTICSLKKNMRLKLSLI